MCFTELHLSISYHTIIGLSLCMDHKGQIVRLNVKKNPGLYLNSSHPDDISVLVLGPLHCSFVFCVFESTWFNISANYEALCVLNQMLEPEKQA